MRLKLVLLILVVVNSLITANVVVAQDKIEGPWLWTIVHNPKGGCEDPATLTDWLKVASNGKFTEGDIATKGVTAETSPSFTGKHQWKEGKLAPTGNNNISEVLKKIGIEKTDPDGAHCSYAIINVVSPKAQARVRMAVGSDDSMKIWLNGKVVYTAAICRGASDYQDVVRIDLKKGNNILLSKVCDRETKGNAGLWSMFIGFATDLTFNLDPFQDVEVVDTPVESIGKLAEKWATIKN